MDVILIPGLWLDASCWDAVLPALRAAGHHPRPLTLPGMESRAAERSGITLADHVAAVVREIDSCAGPVVLVGHSAGCGIGHAALDARPDRVARAVWVAGFPTGDGDVLVHGLSAVDGEVALPDFTDMDEADLAGLDDAALADFRRRAVPAPEAVVDTPQRLTDARRYDVPVTAVATEYTAATLRAWIEAGETPVREFAKLRDVGYVDLPTGHWPQFSRPDDLAAVLVAAVAETG